MRIVQENLLKYLSKKKNLKHNHNIIKKHSWHECSKSVKHEDMNTNEVFLCIMSRFISDHATSQQTVL